MPEMPSEGSVALDADGEKVVVFVFDHHVHAATGGASVQEAELASDHAAWPPQVSVFVLQY